MPRVRFPSGVFGSDACRIQYSRLRWCSGNIQPCQHEFFFFFFGGCYCTVVVLLIIRSIEPRAVHHGHTQCIEHAMAKGGGKKGKRRKSSGSICVAFCIRNRDCRYKYVLLCHTRKWGTPRCAHHQPLRKKKAGNTGTINRPFALTYVSLNQL